MAGGYATLDVALVLLSFILAWGEMWFFDFRVIPLETKAREVLASYGWLSSNERTPLIRSGDSAGSRRIQQYMGSGATASVSEYNFYSPQDTPGHSDDEDWDVEGNMANRPQRQALVCRGSRFYDNIIIILIFKFLFKFNDPISYLLLCLLDKRK